MNDNKLFDLREYNDLYQREIAQEISISRRTYSSWETSTRIIPLKHLNTLSNYYGVSMDYIMGLSKIKTNSKKEFSEINNTFNSDNIQNDINSLENLLKKKYN